MNKEIYNNNQLYDNSNKDINYNAQDYQNSYKNVLQKFKDNVIKVRSKPNVEQGIEMSSQLSSKNPSGENNQNDTDDEDVLKKFQIDSYMKKRRKRLEKNVLEKEQGFSLVKNQLKQQFSLYKLGKIEWAKEHASANRPLNKLQPFTKETKFCNCCNLPCETPGIMERFSACENTENFSVCGKGVPLYFLFFRYCILVLILVLLVMSIPMTILNHTHLIEIEKFCDYKQNNYDFYFEDEVFNKTCEKFIIGNESFATNILNWFWKLDNLIDYKDLLYNMINYKFINNTYNFIEKEKEKQIFLNFSFIGFYCMITLFIINIYFIILLKGRLQKDKKENIQPSDYTLLITDLQRMVKEFKDKNECSLNDDINDNQDNLTGGVSDYEYNNMNYLKTKTGQFTQFLMDTIFYNEKSKQSLNIFNLNLCYKLNEFMILKQKSEKCKYKIFQVEKNPYQIEKNNKNTTDNIKRYYTSPFTLIGLNWLICSNKGVPLDSLYRELEQYDNELNLLVTKAKLDNFCGCIFATFNTVKDKSEFYNKYPHFFIEHIFHYIKNFRYYLCCCLIDKKNLAKYRNRQRMKIHLAPEPEDVVWENMEFTFCQRFKRIIIIYSLTIFLIICAFQIVFTLNKLQGTIKDENWAVILKYSASFSISIVISILNAFLSFILNIFTKMEKQKSKSYFYLSYSIKLTVFTLTTSAIVPFLSNYLNIYYKNLEYNNKTLINNMLMLFLVNSFFTPLIWTLNINLIIKRIKIYFIERKEYMHFKTQKELNDIYELPDMKIATKYSYLFKTLLMTMFYLPIFPIGVPISLLGFILAYFLEKYNFTHNYKRPEMLNQKLGKFYFNFFICIFLSYSFGNYIFYKLAKLDDSWSIISLIFFGILSIIPYTKPISYYFNINKYFNLDSKPMSDMYFSFYNDYQRQNPFTKKEGMYFYITELKKRGYISKFIYDILRKNIEKINVMEIYYDTCIKPSLTQTQTALARVNNNFNFNMEDMKKSIRRVFKEREEKLKIKRGISKRLNTEMPRNFLLLKKEKEKEKKESEKERKEREKKEKKEKKEREKIEKKERKEREKKEKKEKKGKEMEMVEMIEDDKEFEEDKKDNINKNLNIDKIVNSITSINDEDSNSNNNDKNKRKNTEKPKQELQIDNLYEPEPESLDCSLSEAFTDKGSFIFNQYQNPLLLNIGLGIRNLAFMESNEIKRTNAIKRADKIEQPEENDFSNILYEDKE